jgi:Ca-activated chloride channel homolog
VRKVRCYTRTLKTRVMSPIFRACVSLLLTAAALAAGPRTVHPIRVDSTLVLIPVSVTDPANQPVIGLASDQFQLFEGKTEQKGLRLFRDDAPLSVGIVFDASGSMTSKVVEARRAVAEFLKSANPEDEFFLVTFSGEAELTVPFTSDADEIRDRLGSAGTHGKTALLDAVYLALHNMARASNPRRALLVISDGDDNQSRYQESDLRAVLQESDVWVYTIGVFPAISHPIPEAAGDGSKLLTVLAEATGGRHFAIHRANQLPEAAATIALALRNRYVLAYRPALVADGKYHRVVVRLVERRGRHLTWRSGYYAPGR